MPDESVIVKAKLGAQTTFQCMICGEDKKLPVESFVPVCDECWATIRQLVLEKRESEEKDEQLKD